MCVRWRVCVCAFVVGAAALQTQAALPRLLAWVLPLGLLAFATTWSHWRGRRGVEASALVGMAFVAGVAYACEAARQRLGDELPVEWEGRDVIVEGVVSALPEGGERGVRFDFEVERVITQGAVIPRRLGLSIYREARAGRRPTPGGEPPNVRAAERWRLAVRLKRPHGNANPYGFDLEAWLFERGVRATGGVRPGSGNVRLDDFVPAPGPAIERLREIVRERFARALPGKPYLPVLTALVIGDQSGISSRDWNVFWRTGVGHLISISGVHVTMIAGLCAAIARRAWTYAGALALRWPARRVGIVAGVAAALAYSLLAGFSVPTQRTLWMSCAVGWSAFTGGFTSASRVWCAALLAVVLVDPWSSLQPGFLLSFGAVAAILFAAAGSVGDRRPLREAIRTQWAVTIAMVPLQAWLFRQVSLVSPIANAFAIPLVGSLVVPMSMLGAVAPTPLPLTAAHWIFGACMGALEHLAQPTWAMWNPTAPGWPALLAGLCGATWALLPRGFPARWLALPLLAPLVWPAAHPLPAAGFRVTTLDVGQGLAVIVDTRNHRLLYDTGPGLAPGIDAGSRIVVPHVLATGGFRLDGVVVSHRDADHSGGAESVLQGADVAWLLSSLETGHRILDHARRPIRCAAGQRWTWDGVSFDVIYPTLASYEEDRPTNARGCVLRIRSPAGKALLPADIEAASERELLAASAELQADLLIAPHHGSTTSSTPAFVDAVHPAVVVFANGYRNRFGHPKPVVVERYRASGSALFRSDRDGMVTAEFLPGAGLHVEAFRRTRPRYWDGSQAGAAPSEAGADRPRSIGIGLSRAARRDAQ